MVVGTQPVVGSSSVSILGNVGSDVFIPPTLLLRINHYANNLLLLQYVTNCLVSLVPDPPQICMNAANFPVNNSDISPGFGGSAICSGPTTYINGWQSG